MQECALLLLGLIASNYTALLLPGPPYTLCCPHLAAALHCICHYISNTQAMTVTLTQLRRSQALMS